MFFALFTGYFTYIVFCHSGYSSSLYNAMYAWAASSGRMSGSDLETIVALQMPDPTTTMAVYTSCSFILSHALQRAALTSSRHLRYEQAKHIDGLQSDSWILLKCFRSRVGWLTVIAFLDSS